MSVLSDWITLDELVVDCIVGVLEREQHTTQPLRIAVGMQVDLTAAGETGDLSTSVNYAAVAEDIRFMCQHGRFRLIESLGLAALRQILSPPAAVECRAPVQAAWIRIRKPVVLGGNPIPGVEMRRSAPLDRVMAGTADAVQHTLVAVPDSVAYRVELRAGASWEAPPGVAVRVVSGVVRAGDQRVATDTRLPRPAGTLHAETAAVLLAVGQP
jgi:dihydroneopterin aldolase